MRNYNRQYAGTMTQKKDSSDSYASEEIRTKVVIEDNTIYEIDLDCYECKKITHQNP